MTAPIVSARDLTKDFIVRPGRGSATARLRAVDRVNLDIMPGQTLGLVGESGSGKSTTGRLLVGLIPASDGEVTLFGRTITGPGGGAGLTAVRRKLQFVFQDPHGSLDPRMRIGDCIAEPLIAAGGFSRADRSNRVQELLETVGLPRGVASRYPHEFSGGQRQRIGIARALALQAEFIVADEPVSALDVSMQAQIVNLLLDLQEKLGLSYLFIAHDLAVVRSIATDVAVMYAGAIVEQAPKRTLYATPKHPYTQALLEAVPRPDPRRTRPPALGGEVPSMLARPAGCAFSARCPQALPHCRHERPAARALGDGHSVACHLY